jgi:general secretion pathway protein G
MRRREKGFTLIELLIVVAIIGIIAAIAIPNLLNAIDRGKQKRTMADIRSVGTAVEAYAVDNNQYPDVNGTIASNIGDPTNAASVEPIYIKECPQVDGWTNAMVYGTTTSGGDYTIASPGKTGSLSAVGDVTEETPPQTTTFDADIIFSNGSFVQYPEGTQQ